MRNEDKWLVDWFEQRGPVPGNTPEEKLQVDYFESGLIDSFGVIELITEVEQYFKISFEERHFQERRFPIIGGLSELIAELTHSNYGEKSYHDQ